MTTVANDDGVWAVIMQSVAHTWNTRPGDARRVLFEYYAAAAPAATLADAAPLKRTRSDPARAQAAGPTPSAPSLLEQHQFSTWALAALQQLAEVAIWQSNISDSDADIDAAQKILDDLEMHADRVLSASSESKLKSISSFFLGKPSESTAEAERRQRRMQDHVEALVTLADAYGASAMLAFRRQAFTKGAYRLRKAWKHYQKAYEESADEAIQAVINTPRFHNVMGRLQFGTGMFMHFVAMLPSHWRWLVELIGFEGDRDKAVELLEEAGNTKYPSPRATFAKSVLVGTRFFLYDEKDEAIELLTALLEQYPQSVVLLSMLAGLYRRRGEMHLSTKTFEKCLVELKLAPDAELLEQMSIRTTYELGTNRFLSLQWAEAIPMIEAYLRDTTSPNFRCYGAYKLGLCYWVADHKDKIAPLYEQVREWARDSMAYDMYAKRKAEEFLETRDISKTELLVVRAACLNEAQTFEKTVVLLNAAAGVFQDASADYQAQMHYHMGCALRHVRAEDHADALQHLKAAIAFQGHLSTEHWVVPFAWLEIAEMAEERGDLDKVEPALAALNACPSGYDFEKQCSLRQKKIGAKMQKTQESKKKSGGSSTSSTS